MDGVLRCSRYAFGPNRLHYCGPDANKEMLAHIAERKDDAGLTGILSKFETMYPYLKLIADANHIRDPFDDTVVEAYWIGNDLLDGVDKEKLYWHLKDTLSISKRIGSESFRHLVERMNGSAAARGNGVPLRAVPHHAFHVLNVWRRTGHLDKVHTPESVAECIVNIGGVTTVSGPWITVKTRPLLYDYDDALWYFGEPVERKLVRNLGCDADIDDVKVGDTLSYHWGVPCEVLTERQADNLRKYTLCSVASVNQGKT